MINRYRLPSINNAMSHTLRKKTLTTKVSVTYAFIYIKSDI
jgi:hypothetical protein